MRYTKVIVSFLRCSFWRPTALPRKKFKIDSTHSNVNFTVRHNVVAKVSGNFKEFTGAIMYDEKDIAKSAVNVTIKTASVNTQNERRDATKEVELPFKILGTLKSARGTRMGIEAGLTLNRLALGILMFAHGAQKVLGWFGGYGWSGTWDI